MICSPTDMRGDASDTAGPRWLNGARTAVKFVISAEQVGHDRVKKQVFPSIIATSNSTKSLIREAFEHWIDKDGETEFAGACKQVERCCEWRPKDILPA